MIYSASRRTDMPAFFPDELAGKISRSRKLKGLVFWTKDIRNLFSHQALSPIATTIPSIVQYTVTGLAGTEWEPGVPALGAQYSALSWLGRMLPRGAIRWRFDPVIPTPDCMDRFYVAKKMLEIALGYSLDSVSISFPDPYKHAVARCRKAGLAWPTISLDKKKALIAAMAKTFETEAPIELCCEPELLVLPSVRQAHCIDSALFKKLYNLDLDRLEKDKGQRATCGCVQSTDIGAYDMRCRHRCLYCYARPE